MAAFNPKGHRQERWVQASLGPVWTMADDLLSELRKQGQELLGHAQEVMKDWTGVDPVDAIAEGRKQVETITEAIQYRIDKEVGRAFAQHPDLYADLRRGWRQVQKTGKKVAEDLGLR